MSLAQAYGEREACIVLLGTSSDGSADLADINAAGGLNGLGLVSRIRAVAARQIVAIILTGDISTQTLRDITDRGCVQLSKPVKPAALTRKIAKLLARVEDAAAAPALRAPHTPAGLVHLVDDYDTLREM